MWPEPHSAFSGRQREPVLLRESSARKGISAWVSAKLIAVSHGDLGTNRCPCSSSEAHTPWRAAPGSVPRGGFEQGQPWPPLRPLVTVLRLLASIDGLLS